MNIQIALQQFCEFSSFIRGYTPATITRYKNSIGFFIRTENIVFVEDITKQRFEKFMLYGRTERKWSASSFVTNHKSFVVFFRWCVTQGYMRENPAEGMILPKIEKRLPPKLTQQEALRILETAMNYPYPYKFLKYRNHAIFSTFLYTGLRRQELLNLKYDDMDIENKSIFVRQGKGSKDRVIPMCTTLQVSLERYLVERRRLNKTCPEFFVSLNRNMGFTSSGMKRLVKKLRDASGVQFSVHKLRHSFATMMLEGGCDIYSLSKMLGHADLKTTSIYLAASAEHLREQINKHPLDVVATYKVL